MEGHTRVLFSHRIYDPIYRQEINATIPLGAITTRPLAVLWLLYDEYVSKNKAFL